MALKGKTKLVQSKHAKTQYVTIPATIVADSQLKEQIDQALKKP